LVRDLLPIAGGRLADTAVLAADTSICRGNSGNYGKSLIFRRIGRYRGRSDIVQVGGAAGSETINRLIKQREKISHCGDPDRA
jgi:hypothetical protein